MWRTTAFSCKWFFCNFWSGDSSNLNNICHFFQWSALIRYGAVFLPAFTDVCWMPMCCTADVPFSCQLKHVWKNFPFFLYRTVNWYHSFQNLASMLNRISKTAWNVSHWSWQVVFSCCQILQITEANIWWRNGQLGHGITEAQGQKYLCDFIQKNYSYG